MLRNILRLYFGVGIIGRNGTHHGWSWKLGFSDCNPNILILSYPIISGGDTSNLYGYIIMYIKLLSYWRL